MYIGWRLTHLSLYLDTDPTEFTVRLKDGLGGTDNRGEVLLSVWFGPPVRKAFRAAQRASKLLDVRDSVMSTLWSLLGGLLESKYLQGYVRLLCSTPALACR